MGAPSDSTIPDQMRRNLILLPYINKDGYRKSRTLLAQNCFKILQDSSSKRASYEENVCLSQHFPATFSKFWRKLKYFKRMTFPFEYIPINIAKVFPGVIFPVMVYWWWWQLRCEERILSWFAKWLK